MKKIQLVRLGFSIIGIVYVWSLPLLALCGFSEPNSTSISQFISNPPATGAMASISFLPLVLMWEYQDFVISKHVNKESIERKLYLSLASFQLFYGLFLICTDGYVPDELHTCTVVLFSCSFIYHAICVIIYVEPSKFASIILGIGILSFISLLIAKDMWFWAFECIGFSSMLLYTPIDWILYNSDNSFLHDGDFF
tara:strand:- start:4144 stop:4731 length:588 start_codon:yes stop_codon:yes gene_type:complete